jgi:hypothetical protein
MPDKTPINMTNPAFPPEVSAHPCAACLQSAEPRKRRCAGQKLRADGLLQHAKSFAVHPAASSPITEH